MGLLLAVVIFSKKLSAFGASQAMKLGSKLSGASLVAGGIGWTGRITAGMAGNYTAKKLRGTAFGRSFVGRGIAGTLEKRVAGASFDVRNTGLGKAATGIGFDLGKGQTGGYNADLETRVKSYEKAAAGITGGAKEAAEKVAAKKARADMEAAATTTGTARAEQTVAADENKKQKAEVVRLEEEKSKDKYWETNPENVRKLEAARQGVTASDTVLKVADTKLAQAETDLANSIKTEKTAREGIGAAKKQAQIEYGERLENTWGKIPIFGTAAAGAAGRVKGSAGKSKNQLAIEAFMVKAQEAASAGGTTIPTATAVPTPAATPPPTGGAPHP